jgi:hypothetical protein
MPEETQEHRQDRHTSDEWNRAFIDELHRIQPSNSFWHINFGHVITLLSVSVGALGLYFKMDNRVANLEDRFSTLNLFVQEMDVNGTHSSQKGILQESEFNKISERRITAIEEVIKGLEPKIERIDTNISWLINGARTVPNNP